MYALDTFLSVWLRLGPADWPGEGDIISQIVNLILLLV